MHTEKHGGSIFSIKILSTSKETGDLLQPKAELIGPDSQASRNGGYIQRRLGVDVDRNPDLWSAGGGAVFAVR